MNGEKVASFLNGRMDSLGLSHLPSELCLLYILPTCSILYIARLGAVRGGIRYQSFVLPNPPPKTKLKVNDVM